LGQNESEAEQVKGRIKLKQTLLPLKRKEKKSYLKSSFGRAPLHDSLATRADSLIE
jgi:type II secretory pathway predicted ATPase ExeA